MVLQGPLGLISNPNSGHNRDQFDAVRARLDGCPDLHHIITHGPDEIDAALDTLAAKDIALLAINGGDGTSSAILGRMIERAPFKRRPVIALLPAGTANMNAGDIGIRGSLARAAGRLADWSRGERNTRGRLQRRALLKVVPENDPKPHYTMFLGGGAIIQGTEYAHEQLHSRGLRDDFSLALTTVRTIWGVLRDDPRFNQHVRIDLGIDGGQLNSYDTLILAVSTLQRLAFGMRPFWGTEAGPVRLTVMEQGCTRFARTFFSIARGRPSRNAVPASGYRSHNGQRLDITLDGKLNLDGEILAVSGAVAITATDELEFLVL